MTIRPIETSYRGYRFRSRLEAWWAVLFDSLGIGWEYEPQGFLVDDRPFLPDFHIIKHRGMPLDTLVEVKGAERQLDKPFLRRAAMELPKGIASSGLIVLGPIPEPRFDWYWPHLNPTNGEPAPVGFGQWNGRGKLSLWPGRLCDSDYSRYPWLSRHPWLTAYLDTSEPYDAAVVDAYRASRAARFEHGETPAVRAEVRNRKSGHYRDGTPITQVDPEQAALALLRAQLTGGNE